MRKKATKSEVIFWFSLAFLLFFSSLFRLSSQTVEPYEECFRNCERIKVANGVSRGLYANDTCYCIFYIERAIVSYDELKQAELVNLVEDRLEIYYPNNKDFHWQVMEGD